MQPRDWGKTGMAESVHATSSCEAQSVFFSPRRWDFLVSLANGQWQHFPYWCSCVYPVFRLGLLLRHFFFSFLLCAFVWLCSPLLFEFLFMSVVSSKNSLRFSDRSFLFRQFENPVWKTASSVLTSYTKYESLYFLYKDDTAFWDLIFRVQVIIVIASHYLCYCSKWNSTQLSQYVCVFNLQLLLGL